MNRLVTGILIGLFLLILLAIILIIVLGDKGTVIKVNVPDKIDVVLVDQGRGRLSFQIRNIDKYMPWVHSVIVLHVLDVTPYTLVVPDPEEKNNESVSERPIITINTKETRIKTLFENIKEISPEVSDYFLFFGDTTLPAQEIKPEYLWSQTSKTLRMFNFVDVDARNIGFQTYFEDTMPVSLIHVEDLVKAGSLDFYILTMSVTNQIVYSPFINRTIILTDNEFADEEQLEQKNELIHFYTTFLISPQLSLAAKEHMNQKIINKMVTDSVDE